MTVSKNLTNSSLITTAEKISWTNDLLILLKQKNLTQQEIEEVLLNFPKVKKIALQFADQHEHFYVLGATDLGKRIALVLYIQQKKIFITYIKSL